MVSEQDGFVASAVWVDIRLSKSGLGISVFSDEAEGEVFENFESGWTV